MKSAPHVTSKRITLSLVACLALAVSLSHAHDKPGDDHAPPAAKAFPFEPSEELVYQADYSKLMVRGLEIAEFRFTSSRAPAGAVANADSSSTIQTQNLVFNSDARAKGWFHKLFGMDFHYTQQSLVSPEGFLILRTTKRDEQDKRVRESVAEFDRRADRVTWTERNPNDPAAAPRVVTSTVRDAAHDFISAIYFLRMQRLAVGQSYDLVVSDDGQTYHVPVKVSERRALSSVVGKVQTLRLDVEMFGKGHLVDNRQGTMTLWITDDPRRLPVRARLDIDIGTLDIKLKQVNGGSVAVQPPRATKR
jgi:hypothetical protein